MANEKRGVLVSLNGAVPNEVVKLRRDATIFGREKADIVLDDHQVSSTHCQIQAINEVYHLFDMNSTNGTFVNNSRIVKARLKGGDVITIGSTSFKFLLEDEHTVRKLPSLFQSGRKPADKDSTIVDTLIASELRPKAANIRITVIYANGEQEIFELSQRIIYIGRASSFGRFDQDSEISRKHLMIKRNDTGEIFVEDQGSTNGSFINEKKISGMHPVSPKDEIKVGACRLFIAII